MNGDSIRAYGNPPARRENGCLVQSCECRNGYGVDGDIHVAA